MLWLLVVLFIGWAVYKIAAGAAKASDAPSIRFAEIPPSDDEYEPVRRIRSKVAGVTKEGRQRTIRAKCRAGDLLWFFHEPNNPKDVNAIQVRRVVKNGTGPGQMAEQIGYVSRELAQDIAPHLDRGEVAIGQITQITGGEAGRPSIGVNIEVFLYRKIATAKPNAERANRAEGKSTSR